MKLRFISALGLFIVQLVLLGTVGAQTASPSAGSLTVTVTPSALTLYEYEPLQLVIHVRNSSAKTVTAEESWQPFTWFKLEGNSDWKLFRPDHFPALSPLPPYPVTFQPGEELTLTDFVDINSDGQNVFANAGKVQIRVMVGRLKSEPVTVTVAEPTGEDKAALEDLKTSGLTRFIAMFPARYGYSDEKIKILSDLASKHGSSIYGIHSAYAAALLEIEKGSPEDLKRARRTLEGLNARQASPRALYWLSELARKQGDNQAAVSYLYAAAATKGNPYFREEARAGTEGKLRPHAVNAKE